NLQYLSSHLVSTLFPYTTLFRSHVGPVWIRLYPHPDNIAKPHVVRLRWGPWACDHQIESLKPSVCLVTSKGPDAFSVPIFVAVRSEEHTSELQSLRQLVCCLLLE